MSDVGRTRCRRSHRRLLVATALLTATLLACGRPAPVEVAVAGLPPKAPPASDLTTKFQGSVTSVDAGAGALVMAVRIVWTPVLKAEPHERRVVVDPGTGWEPASVGLADVRVGEEIQVEAVETPAGSWQALRVQLFDID